MSLRVAIRSKRTNVYHNVEDDIKKLVRHWEVGEIKKKLKEKQIKKREDLKASVVRGVSRLHVY